MLQRCVASTRACVVGRCVPRARGLALGYTLSPAARACLIVRCVPRARGLALGYTLSPAARACTSIAIVIIISSLRIHT